MEASNPNKSRIQKGINLYESRLLFLGRITDGSLILIGLVLISAGLVRLLNIYDSPLSVSQILQSFLGLILLITGIFRKGTIFLKTFKEVNKQRLKKIIGIFPLIVFFFFLIYRIQLKDIESYRRLVEEGSLVEWLSFFFLLLTALILVITGIKELKTLVGKFVIAFGGLSFVLAMEEVSWGQMIFNWESPEFFIQSNAQQETNIHNLLLISGEPNTLIVTLVLVSLCVFCLLRRYLEINKKIMPNTLADFILPPLFLIGYFAIGALIYFGLIMQMKGIVVPILIPSDQEIFECFFALGILLNSFRIYINWGNHLSFQKEDI